MPETIQYDVRIDPTQLQSELALAQTTIGMGLQNVFAAPANAFQTGGLAFNTVNADIQAARQTFAITTPQFPQFPFAFPQAGGPAQFVDPAADVGFVRGLLTRFGVTPPPAMALMSDVSALQRLQLEESVTRGAAGVGSRLLFPLLTGAIGGAAGGFFGHPILGGIAGAIAGEAIGGAVYGQFVTERERSLLLRASGIAEPQAQAVARGITESIGTDPLFQGLSDTDITGFVAQQAFGRRVRPGNTPQDVQRAVEGLREDMRAVLEIQGALNLAFEDAAAVFGELEGLGVQAGRHSGVLPGRPAAGQPGTVRQFLAQVRSMGAFGFTPDQQRQAAFRSIQFGQQLQGMGIDPRAAFLGVGIQEAQAAELFRAAQGTDDPLLMSVRRMGTPARVAQGFRRAAEGVAQSTLVQGALLAGLTETEDLQAAVQRAGEVLAGGPAGVREALTESLAGLTPAQTAARLAGARGRLGAAQQLLAEDPRLRTPIVSGLMGAVDRGIPGFAGLTGTEQAGILSEALGIPLGSARAELARVQNEGLIDTDRQARAVAAALSDLRTHIDQTSASLTNRLKAAADEAAGSLLRILDKGAGGFLSPTNLGRGVKVIADYIDPEGRAAPFRDEAMEFLERHGGLEDLTPENVDALSPAIATIREKFPGRMGDIVMQFPGLVRAFAAREPGNVAKRIRDEALRDAEEALRYSWATRRFLQGADKDTRKSTAATETPSVTPPPGGGAEDILTGESLRQVIRELSLVLKNAGIRSLQGEDRPQR